MKAALGYERIRMSLQPETPRVVRICGPTLSAHWLTSMNSNNVAIKSLVFRAARGLLCQFSLEDRIKEHQELELK